MSFTMHRDGEPAIPIPPDVERATIEAGSDAPVEEYCAKWMKEHPAETKAAKDAFKKAAKATTDAAPAALTQEG